jgi:hypothetical protein
VAKNEPGKTPFGAAKSDDKKKGISTSKVNRHRAHNYSILPCTFASFALRETSIRKLRRLI